MSKKEQFVKRFLFLAVAAMATLSVAAAPTRDPLTPLADHHAHMLSPAAVKLVNDPPQPEIELPEDLTRLLRAREKGWNDKSALVGLYTEDSLVFDILDSRWIRGRDEVAGYLAGRFARPYRVTPIA